MTVQIFVYDCVFRKREKQQNLSHFENESKFPFLFTNFCLQIFVYNCVFPNNTQETFHIRRVAIQLHFIWLLGTTILKLLSFCLKTEPMLTLKIREVWYHCIMLHPMAIWILPLYLSGTYAQLITYFGNFVFFLFFLSL